MISTAWKDTIMSTVYPATTSNFFIGLSSTKPNASGGNITEPSGNGYARAAVSGFTAPNNGVVKNKAAITFPESTGIWFPASARAAYWAMFNGSGTFLCGGALDSDIAVLESTTITIEANKLTIGLTDDDAV